MTSVPRTISELLVEAATRDPDGIWLRTDEIELSFADLLKLPLIEHDMTLVCVSNEVGGPYAGKPRPAVIVQEDRFDSTSSITLCVFTTDSTEAPLLRMLIEPTDRNGLSSASRLMVDKVTTVPKARLGKRIGKLNDEDVVRLNRALTVFLGLAR